ncbi:hypothetical protein ABZ630_02060 [Streptomyces albidoflavus]
MYSNFFRKQVKAPYVHLLREKYRIRFSRAEKEYMFVITDIQKSSGDNGELYSITAKTVEYILSYHRVDNYKVQSVSIEEVMADVVKNTPFKIGHISEKFNHKRRQFDISSTYKLDFIYQIADAFEAIVQFDGINNLIHFYDEEELVVDTNLTISENNYLYSMTDSKSLDDIVTRMYGRGSEGLQFHSVNPTGKPYIDDFSYFLHPFKRDENRNVISRSNYMSDELCHEILDYNKFVSDNQNKFRDLLDKKRINQDKRRNEEIKLSSLESDLQIAQDLIDLYNDGAQEWDLEQLKKDYREKLAKVKNQKTVIIDLEKEGKLLNEEIATLNSQFSLENNIGEDLIIELYDYIQEGEWSDDTYIDETDLYEGTFKELRKRNLPKVNVNLEAANFPIIKTEQHNWKRFDVGHRIRLKHDSLHTEITSVVMSYDQDYKQGTFSININDGAEDNYDRFADIIYTVQKQNTDYNIRKIDYTKVANDFSKRNNRIATPVKAPTLLPNFESIQKTDNPNGTVNIRFSWIYTKDRTIDETNIDGFFVYIRQSKSDEPYQIQGTRRDENYYNANPDMRSYTFNNLTANDYYTFAVAAYRMVDSDINRENIIISDLVQPKRSQ